MMSIFHITEEEMRKNGSVYTLTEICQQPCTWKKTCEQLTACKGELQDFLDRTIKQEDFDIVLAGAGSSEFIGNSLYQTLNRQYGCHVRSAASTDLAASPEDFLSRTRPTLLVSFGRSVDSPESVGAVENADAVCQCVSHLFITCNPDGALAKMAKERENCFILSLTPETCDKSFAMTSSFSNMRLAAYLAFHLEKLPELTASIDKLCDAAAEFMENGFAVPEAIVRDFDFNRIVYLGASGLKGIAQESALKMLELTAGNVEIMFDTPLGFRHGPKSIINDRTLTVLYLSDDSYQRQYELDLIREMSPERKKNCIAAVMNIPCAEVKELTDYTVEMNLGEPMENALLGFDFILFAQILAVLKSLSLGITPDNPCPTGEVNRVVKGVTLYPYPHQ